MISEGVINSIILTILAALFSFAGAYYLFHKSTLAAVKAEREAADRRLLERIAELEKNAALFQQTVLPISAVLQSILVKQLTHSDTPEMDELMERIGPPSVLTEADEKRLATLLAERAADPTVPRVERDAAAVLPIVRRMVVAQTQAEANGPDSSQLRLVSVLSTDIGKESPS